MSTDERDFFQQEEPRLGNQYLEDSHLVALLRRKVPQDVLQQARFHFDFILIWCLAELVVLSEVFMKSTPSSAFASSFLIGISAPSCISPPPIKLVSFLLT